MPLPTSTLSQVSRSVADFVTEGLDAANLSIRVMIGSPAAAAAKEAATEHRVNLFFYRLEPWDFDADALPGETGWLRLHCLITAFGVSEDNVSEGENDLRLLGEVVRLFHEAPVMAVGDVDGETVGLQVVLQPLTSDEINHLWSTQGDVAYRTSVAYEMAVAPVVPKTPARGSPLVGSVTSEVHEAMRVIDGGLTGLTYAPPAVPVAIDAELEAWAPHICFVHEGTCAYTLAFALGSDALAAFQPAVVIVGDPGSDVTLQWDEWRADTGWASAADPQDATATVPSLTPGLVGTLTTTDVALPTDDVPGQVVLYAQRTYSRAVDGAALTVRSNPLLVTLYETVT